MPETGRTGLLPRCSGAANGGYSPRRKARGAFATPSAPCLSDGVGTRGVPTHRRNALAARRRTRGLVWSSPLRTLPTDLGGHHRKFLDTESPIQASGRSLSGPSIVEVLVLLRPGTVRVAALQQHEGAPAGVVVALPVMADMDQPVQCLRRTRILRMLGRVIEYEVPDISRFR